MSRIKQETISGAKWLLLQKITLQPLQFLYSMVLARLITPEEMGIVGLTAVFFSIAETLASAGFGSALIRRVDRTDIDCDTAFWFNVGMSCLMSVALYSAAPWFVQFYGQPELLWLTRCSAIMMLLNSTAGVHWTLYTARRDFRSPAIVQVVSIIVSMPVCLTLAYLGWGVWALMIGGITSSLLSLVWVWIISPWKPRFRFSGQSFRDLFGFGSKLTAANLITTIFNNIRPFIIGKFYSPTDLGMYVKGARVGMLMPQTITSVLTSVTYPIMATIQNDRQRLIGVYRKYVKVVSLPITIGCMLIAALAEPMVGVCFGEQWLPCAIFVQLVSVAMMFDHVSTINMSVLQVLGRSGVMLGLEIVKKTCLLGMILYAATISVTAMCSVSLIYGQLAIFLNSCFTGRFLGISWWSQQKDYFPYIIRSAAAVLPAYLLTYTELPGIVIIILGGLSAVIIYFLLLIMRKDIILVEFFPMIEKKLPMLRGVLTKLRSYITATECEQ